MHSLLPTLYADNIQNCSSLYHLFIFIEEPLQGTERMPQMWQCVYYFVLKKVKSNNGWL